MDPLSEISKLIDQYNKDYPRDGENPIDKQKRASDQKQLFQAIDSKIQELLKNPHKSENIETVKEKLKGVIVKLKDVAVLDTSANLFSKILTIVDAEIKKESAKQESYFLQDLPKELEEEILQLLNKEDNF